MSKVEATFVCPLCKTGQKATFRKPSFLGQSYFGKECSNCLSKFRLIVTRKPGGKNVSYTVICEEDNFTITQEKIEAVTDHIAKEMEIVCEKIAKGVIYGT